jgi:hypothetical protein
MTITYSYPVNRFAFPGSSQVAPAWAARPSPVHSNRALSDKDGPGNAKSEGQGEARPEAGADNREAEKRPILHLNVAP